MHRALMAWALSLPCVHLTCGAGLYSPMLLAGNNILLQLLVHITESIHICLHDSLVVSALS